MTPSIASAFEWQSLRVVYQRQAIPLCSARDGSGVKPLERKALLLPACCFGVACCVRFPPGRPVPWTRFSATGVRDTVRGWRVGNLAGKSSGESRSSQAQLFAGVERLFPREDTAVRTNEDVSQCRTCRFQSYSYFKCAWAGDNSGYTPCGLRGGTGYPLKCSSGGSTLNV